MNKKLEKEIRQYAKNYFISECMQNGSCDESDLFEMIKYGYNLALEDVRREVKNIKAPIEYNKMEEESFYSSLSTVIDFIDDLT